MAGTTLLSLQVADLVTWFRDKTLVVNETFQRRAVWTAPAKTYLIDTILIGMPIPKMYIRTKVDPVTQKSIREIVDGQQRMRAIVEFASDELRLTKRSKEYATLRYSDLDEDTQERFLGYIIAVEQLLNASDEDVLEIFARLNSYTVTLNAAEKRHARFQTEFKWAVREAAQEWHFFFEEREVLSLRQRFRMRDDELLAEMYRVLIEGVRDGGDPKLKALYEAQSDAVFTASRARRIRARLDDALRFLNRRIGDAIRDELAKPHQVLMMFAAYLHHRYGIPRGDIRPMPRRRSVASPKTIRERLNELLGALQAEVPPESFRPYVVETRLTSPQRIAARRIRFREMVRVFGA